MNSANLAIIEECKLHILDINALAPKLYCPQRICLERIAPRTKSSYLSYGSPLSSF